MPSFSGCTGWGVPAAGSGYAGAVLLVRRRTAGNVSRKVQISKQCPGPSAGPGRGGRGQLASAISLRPPKSEIRNPKSETNPKAQGANAQNERARWRLGLGIFPVGACFGFRVSDFGFDLNGAVVLSNHTTQTGLSCSTVGEFGRTC